MFLTTHYKQGYIHCSWADDRPDQPQIRWQVGALSGSAKTEVAAKAAITRNAKALARSPWAVKEISMDGLLIKLLPNRFATQLDAMVMASSLVTKSSRGVPSAMRTVSYQPIKLFPA